MIVVSRGLGDGDWRRDSTQRSRGAERQSRKDGDGVIAWDDVGSFVAQAEGGRILRVYPGLAKGIILILCLCVFFV